MTMLAGVPVKQFGIAKRRLASRLTAAARSALGRDLARRTVAVLADAGFDPVVIAADRVVGHWANALGYRVLDEPSPGGLDQAAAALVAAAERGQKWAIVHADLPLLRPGDLAGAAGTSKWLVAPSRDGGTNVLVGSSDAFPFAYGPGSGARHLAAAARRGPVHVATNVRLGLDLDTPRDFDAIVAHSDGRWLTEYVLGSRR